MRYHPDYYNATDDPRGSDSIILKPQSICNADDCERAHVHVLTGISQRARDVRLIRATHDWISEHQHYGDIPRLDNDAIIAAAEVTP